MTLQDLGSLGELIAAIATVATLIYLALQVRTSNRLARAEASRVPNSDLNAVNAAFGTDPIFRAAIGPVLNGATRDELEPEQRIVVDFYLISLTNIQEQLAREIREGILAPDGLDFGGAGMFLLPFYRASWPLYRRYLSSTFVKDFEISTDSIHLSKLSPEVGSPPNNRLQPTHRPVHQPPVSSAALRLIHHLPCSVRALPLQRQWGVGSCSDAELTC